MPLPFILIAGVRIKESRSVVTRTQGPTSADRHGTLTTSRRNWVIIVLSIVINKSQGLYFKKNVLVKYAVTSALSCIHLYAGTFIHFFLFRLTTRMTGASSSSTWQSWRPSSSPSSTGTSQTSHSPGLNRCSNRGFVILTRELLCKRACSLGRGVKAGQILPSWLTGMREGGCQFRICTVSYPSQKNCGLSFPSTCSTR
jgi:hypothetical protein